jgi:hypothetical protein
MPVLLTVPSRVIVDVGDWALKVASFVLLEKVSAFNEGLPERPNIFNAL